MYPHRPRAALQGSLPYLTALAGALALFAIIAIAAHGKPARARPAPTGIIVLDDCDPVFSGKARYEDNLSFFNPAGTLQARVSGLNVCEEIGCAHRIAIDVERQRVWLTETVGERLLQYDLSGQQTLSVPKVRASASALAVDPVTGHVWVARGGVIGKTSVQVFDQTGRSQATHDLRAYDIAYDRKGKAFWMVEQQLVKVSPEGKVLVQKNIAEWCAVSVAVHQRTGNVWVAARQYRAKLGRNEVLAFDNTGTLLHTIALGDRMPFRVSVDEADGSVWVTNFGKSILRISAAGRRESEYPVPALTAEVEPYTGNVWVVCAEEILKIDRKGAILARTKRKAKTSQAWITAY